MRYHLHHHHHHHQRVDIINDVTIIIMSVLLLSILGVSTSLQHCPMWKEIAPCTCRMDSIQLTKIVCDKMRSFEQVMDLLGGHFVPQDKVILKIGSSDLKDFSYHKLKELNMTIENLQLNHDHLSYLNPDTFDGLTKVHYLSLADNVLEDVPEELWKKMPNIRLLDMGRTKIRALSETSFIGLPQLNTLILPGNQISRIDRNSIPKHLSRLHLGRNYLKDLNDTLKDLNDLGWLFINSNDLSTLEGQLPRDAPNLQLIFASHNKIEKLPQQLKSFTRLQSIFFQNNRLKSLDGTLPRNLIRAVLEHNQINIITPEDFAESEMLEILLLGHNQITTLNNSLSNLRSLNFLNMTYNYLTEFSFQDVEGLLELQSIDLSFNKIKTLIGPAANLVEWNFKLSELKLDHNEIEYLNGALSGLTDLLIVNLSFNKLKRISPDDFIGLDQLKVLDISHNYLTTLEETSKTFLPRLSELKASDNYLTILERDFHGLPVLCHADLSNNQIVALGRDLVAKTRCTIEHGVHEGTWDTLKINLQDNPILCDAALPEIMSLMEINHTRIYGVSHCPPLNEQPTTSKPNGYLGYVPDLTTTTSSFAVSSTTPQLLSVNDDVHFSNVAAPQQADADVVIQPDMSSGMNVPAYAIDSSVEAEDVHNSGLAITLQKPKVGGVVETTPPTVPQIIENTFDPVQQGQQINKLASEIEELRTRIDELSSQNQLLLKQSFNKTTVVLDDKFTELRKP